MLPAAVASKRGRRVLCALLVAAASLLVGRDSPPPVSVSITPAWSLLSQPVHIVVSGLGSGRNVTVELRSADVSGLVWTSAAVFRSTRSGTVDLATDSAVSGSYQGVDPMGLIDALSPVPGQPGLTALYAGDGVKYAWNGQLSQDFQVTVTENGAPVAIGAFSRTADGPGVTATGERIAAVGFFGHFWKPAPGGPPRPGVLEFGGSEGGLGGGQTLASALASDGYPTLDLAYFGEPGLPSKLRDIPLEYFARAVRWLARQRGVLHHEVYVSGLSRGSEAALLLGAYFPGLVRGVIASVPSDVAICSYPDCSGPAWTLHGKALPFTAMLHDPYPTDNPAAVIPVQRIQAPVFLDCGTTDQVWPSCGYAQAIQRHLTAAGDRYPHVLYRYLGAGHFVSTIVPHQPFSPGVNTLIGQGDTPLSNDDAEARLWPALLSFLADPSQHTGTFTAPATPPPLNLGQ
jgi:dienelactone hydrolase